jgi:hypothetical protein
MDDAYAIAMVVIGKHRTTVGLPHDSTIKAAFEAWISAHQS